MKHGKKVLLIAAFLCIMFVAQGVSAESGVETDDADDVIVFETTNQEETQYETDELPSADIVKVSYDRVDGGTEVTVQFEVNDKGIVEETVDIYNLNESAYLTYFSEPVPLAYLIMVTTDQAEYSIEYIFGNCTMNYEDVIEYTIDDNVFTATFDLDAANETIESIGAQSMFMELSIVSQSSKFFMDAAPDSFLFFAEISGPTTAESGEEIELSGITTNLASILDLGVTEGDYTYEWDFDDGSSGTGETVTHSYQNPGKYTVELTVSDAEGTQTTATKEIIVSQGSGDNNNQNNGNDDNDGDSEDSPILMFIAIIAIIVVIGVVALIVVIRR